MRTCLLGLPVYAGLAMTLWLLPACGTGTEDACTAGEEGCSCGAGGACEAGLACRSSTCVDLEQDSTENDSGSSGKADASGTAGSSTVDGGDGEAVNSGGAGGDSGSGNTTPGPDSTTGDAGGGGSDIGGGSGDAGGGNSTSGPDSTAGDAGGETATSGDGGTSMSGGDDPANTPAPSGSACPVTADDFLEPTFDGTSSFSVPAVLGGGFGGWTSYGDETSDATITLTAASVPGGTNSITCEASGFTEWGGCLVVFHQVLDLTSSGRNALQFWARAQETHEVRVNLSDRGSDYQGGICDGAQNCFENCCFDHYGSQFTTTADWTQYTLRFDELTREDGNGPPLDFDPSHVRELGFRLVEGADFELEIDELAFVNCE